MDEANQKITASEAHPESALSDSYFKQFADLAPNCFLVISKDTTRIRYANNSFFELTGFSREQLRDEDFSFISLLEAPQRERLNIHLNRVQHDVQKRNRYVIYNLRSNRQKEIPRFYVYASPVTSDTGEELYSLMIVPELSKWNLPFTSFDTREMFLEMLSGFGFGTFEWIIDQDRVFWSEGIYEVYEVDKKRREIGLADTEAFTHPDDHERFAKAIERTVATGEPYDLQVRIITGKRNLKYINTVGRLIRDEHNQPLKIVGSVQDITQQKENELSIKRHMSELNRSNRELEEFAYVASHDLQEPLRKVSTFSDRLHERIFEDLDEDSKFYLQRIIAAASNMRQLINNLLEFSRVTKGNLSFSNVSLDFIMREVKGDLEIKISETEAEIEIGKMPEIEADPVQMRLLFMNLIGNALKFRKENVSPKIRISSRLLNEEEMIKLGVDHHNEYYEILVNDNGIGFEEEYANRIFLVFQRLHGKAEYPGSGIGLAICKKIADHHHGMISASGVPGEGATFRIILPKKQ